MMTVVIEIDHVIYLSALNTRPDYFFLVLITVWQKIHCWLQEKTNTKAVLWQGNRTYDAVVKCDTYPEPSTLIILWGPGAAGLTGPPLCDYRRSHRTIAYGTMLPDVNSGDWGIRSFCSVCCRYDNSVRSQRLPSGCWRHFAGIVWQCTSSWSVWYYCLFSCVSNNNLNIKNCKPFILCCISDR